MQVEVQRVIQDLYLAGVDAEEGTLCVDGGLVEGFEIGGEARRGEFAETMHLIGKIIRLIVAHIGYLLNAVLFRNLFEFFSMQILFCQHFISYFIDVCNKLLMSVCDRRCQSFWFVEWIICISNCLSFLLVVTCCCAPINLIIKFPTINNPFCQIRVGKVELSKANKVTVALPNRLESTLWIEAEVRNYESVEVRPESLANSVNLLTRRNSSVLTRSFDQFYKTNVSFAQFF